MLQRILVPLDGSQFAESALETAREVAGRRNASLELVSVHAPMPPLLSESGAPVSDPRFDMDHRNRLRDYIERMGAAERGRSTLPTRVTFLEGNVAPTLVSHIRSARADLVVMTTHGRGGLERLWMGSTADRVVREGSAPVLLVKSGREDEQPAGPQIFQKVVIALGRSQEDQRVIDTTLAVSDHTRASYTLMHVVLLAQVIPASQLGTVPVPDEMAALSTTAGDEEMAAAHRYLEPIATRLRSDGLSVETQVEKAGSVARAIVEFAKRSGADLIAMGTRAPGRVERLVLGSVADKVMRSAPMSVLVCPPPAG